MSITVTELKRRNLGTGFAERVYLIKGTEDEAAAKAALLANTPGQVDGFDVPDASVREYEGEVRAEIGGAFIGRVRWTKGRASIEQPVGSESARFYVRVAPTLIRQSRQTVASYPNNAGWTGRFGGAINVDQDGSVQGVQWPPSGAQGWGFTAIVDPDDVTTAYYRQLSFLAGGMNNAIYKGFEPGELFFVGASGQRSGQADWSIDYDFLVAENGAENWTLYGANGAGTTYSIDKKGWDYLWFHYAEVEHQEGGQPIALVKKPLAAYVERVAREVNFADLAP